MIQITTPLPRVFTLPQLIEGKTKMERVTWIVVIERITGADRGEA